MAKRIFIGALWLVATMWAWNLVALFTGLPSELSLTVGIAVGAFVAVDPIRLFFARPTAAAATALPQLATARVGELRPAE